MIETLKLFEWDVGMTAWGLLALVAGGVVIGIALQYIGDVTNGYEWSFASVAAVVGGWIGSEALTAAKDWGPTWEGMVVVPALIGAVALGFVVDFVVRLLTGGSLVHHAHPV